MELDDDKSSLKGVIRVHSTHYEYVPQLCYSVVQFFLSRLI
jgi:hypothetical protein